MVTRERENHTGHRRLLPLAHEIEVQHALEAGLQRGTKYFFSMPSRISLILSAKYIFGIHVSNTPERPGFEDRRQ